MNPNRVILEMIGQLHDRGFEGIRLCPQLSNSGVHWIAWLASAEHALPNHGAILHPTAMMQAMRMTDKAMCEMTADGFMWFSLDVAVFGDEGCALPQFYDCEVL